MNSRRENLERLQQVKCFFLDLDGTFYLENQILPGSLEFLDEMLLRNIKVLFLTNNSSKSASFYLEKLQRMGVREPFLKVLTSGNATCNYAKRKFLGKKAFLLANHLVKAEMLEQGLLIDDRQPDYVIITYDTELDYHKLDRVCHFVRQGLPYIASHPDFNCPMEYGFAPDIGATIAYIEASTGRRPDLILGKPYAGLLDEALQLMNCQSEEVAMVGDRLYTDIEAAIRHQLLGILVMSGETDARMLAESTTKPDLIYPNLIDIVKDFIN